jgi:hypothetical protein
MLLTGLTLNNVATPIINLQSAIINLSLTHPLPQVVLTWPWTALVTGHPIALCPGTFRIANRQLRICKNSYQ